MTFWALAEIVKARGGHPRDDPPGADGGEAPPTPSPASSPMRRRRSWLERHLRPLAGLAEDEASRARTRASRPGGASSRRSPSSGRSCSSSRICTGRTMRCSTSSTGLVDRAQRRAAARPRQPLARSCSQRRPGWGGGKPNALTISLSPLSDEETARLVQALLERPLLEAETQEALLARAGGNPLYAEQYARVLRRTRRRARSCRRRCRGSSPPGSTRSPSEEKGLLQDAAVVGKVFWLGALEAVDGVHALAGGGAAPRARAQGVRPACSRLLGRRARPSTPSATCSSATSPTGRFRAPARSTQAPSARRPGSSRSAAPTSRPSCSPTTTCRRSSSRGRRARRGRARRVGAACAP